MDDLVRNGRKLYAAREFGKALINFTRAMHMCPCNKSQKRKRCTCKDYEAVASRDGSIYDEAMFTCTCDASKLFSKCEDVVHLAALDSRAATFEALRELDRAEADAKWMLELAPGLPHADRVQGYLRFGKIARLRKNAWLAWKIYSAGADANKHTSLESSPQLQVWTAVRNPCMSPMLTKTDQKLKEMLQPLQMRFKRKDPLNLPLELVHQIFGSLSIVDLTYVVNIFLNISIMPFLNRFARKCLRVSRAWKHILTSGQSISLWRQLVFLEPLPRPPSVRAIKALVERSGRTVRDIVVRKTSMFKLNQEKLAALLWHSKTLEHLDITHSFETLFPFPNQPGSYRKLRSLTMNYDYERLAASAVAEPFNLRPLEFISLVAANSLEHLDLINIPPEWCLRDALPDFPRLKTLRLEQRTGAYATIPFPIFELASKSRRLEQLCLDSFFLRQGPSPLMRDWHTHWVDLKVFAYRLPVLRRSINPLETFTCVMLVNSIQLGNGFRHLELDIPYDNHLGTDTNGFLYSVRESMTPALAETISRMPRLRQFAQLRSLRLNKLSQSPRTMQNLLQDAIANGKFRDLDIVFPLDDARHPEGFTSVQHLRGYDWLRGLETIRDIGLLHFNFPLYPTRDDDDPLPAFLGTFPNLDIVSLASDHVTDSSFYHLVTRIVAETSVKTIYQTCVQGSTMDRIGVEGAQLGVEIIWGERPRQWPVPLEEE
ncbi:hypothetical protein L249_1032 [Ophiocordyceps polyrhachis-furcata BCC 54312]|uniref:F-box domain-containing protein n=1 Tax=Ophiocordyceps polyrhachis-furcata BCC 54312 TaxID=1330021 RepID=A0A367LFZ0_9HYPO|nr:hypothetical protein L249_1032 [Ophiocordyceps polyrhachis-furcata BCC 54312]